jgi:hypothetical protein
MVLANGAKKQSKIGASGLVELGEREKPHPLLIAFSPLLSQQRIGTARRVGMYYRACLGTGLSIFDMLSDIYTSFLSSGQKGRLSMRLLTSV